MSLLWSVPPVAVAVGATLVLVQMRSIAAAAADLQGEMRRLGEVRLAVAEVRSASADARSSVRSLHRA